MTSESEIEKEKRIWKLAEDCEMLKAKVAILEISANEEREFRANLNGVVTLMKIIGLISTSIGALWFVMSAVYRKDGGV